MVSGEERRSITHRCVLAMATAVLTRSKCLFVLEDLHCFDGPSFEVVLGILKPMQQCCCIVTYRPFSSESKAHFVSQLTQIGGFVTSESTCHSIMCQVFDQRRYCRSLRQIS